MKERTVIQLRVKPEEKERLRAEAARLGMDLSNYLKFKSLPEGPQTSGTGPMSGSGSESRPGERENVSGASGSSGRRSDAVGAGAPPAGFRCPTPSCGFGCSSAAGVCPVHGRKVVEDA